MAGVDTDDVLPGPLINPRSLRVEAYPRSSNSRSLDLSLMAHNVDHAPVSQPDRGTEGKSLDHVGTAPPPPTVPREQVPSLFAPTQPQSPPPAAPEE